MQINNHARVKQKLIGKIFKTNLFVYGLNIIKILFTTTIKNKTLLYINGELQKYKLGLSAINNQEIILIDTFKRILRSMCNTNSNESIFINKYNTLADVDLYDVNTFDDYSLSYMECNNVKSYVRLYADITEITSIPSIATI